MWLLLNSAGRCSAICDQTGVSARPSVVRRNRRYASWSASLDDECHQIIRSASARSPATSYVPRTVTSLPASSVKSDSTSSTTFSRSDGRGLVARYTDHIV